MDLPATRLHAQGLVDPDLVDPVGVVDRLLAVQAQDPRGARLAVRARLAESVEAPAASAVDEALNDRSLVVGWLNRGTLHLVRAEDYRWLAGLTSPRLLTSNRTRLKQEGVSVEMADRGVDLVRKRLGDGPATRGEIKDVLEPAGIPVAGQALIHIIYLASLQGHVLRGPMKGKDQAFVLVEDWIGETKPVEEEEEALAELARRYLTGHGPATDRDLARWAGIALGKARAGLKAIGGELVEEDGLVNLTKRKTADGVAGTRLLGSFDPILHGWESREWIVPGERERGVVTTNGIFRPTILDGQRIVGTWKLTADRFEPSPFEAPGTRITRNLEREAERVREYLSR